MKVCIPYKYMIKALCLSLFILITSCNSTKLVVDPEAMSQLEGVLKSRKYRIDVKTVFPFSSASTQQVFNNVLINNVGNTASRIDVDGENYFVQLKDTIAEASLPYFGEQQLVGSRFGSDDIGVAFDGDYKKYVIEKHKKKDTFVVKFETNDSVDLLESYVITMTVYGNNTVDIVIISSHRMGINYRGILKPIESEETAL